MPLKEYQKRVLQEVQLFLEELARQQAAGTRRATLETWDALRERLGLCGNYHERRNALGGDLPSFYVKVPTGGGKTLLATQILGLIYQTILKSRNGTGLVLWVVPSDQIYKDTLKALRDRQHFYRESLEFALSRRIEVWEKHEIMRLTPAQLKSNLNILLLMLPSTNRQDREQLKFFRDCGGNIVQHFPPEDQPEKHRELKQQVPNLELLEDTPRNSANSAVNNKPRSARSDAEKEVLLRTSLANLVRLCEPAVILDEGHKAASPLAQETIEGFNASIVIELSATPPAGANILVRVSGTQLLDEQMIKLPMNVACSNVQSPKECLTQARDKREELARLAERWYRESEAYIRPIVLVQVERTGKDQRGANFIHSEDVKEHLMQKLGVHESAIAIKTASQDDLEKLEQEGISLGDEGCPVEWIITKGALQEGWDCPFAYLLVSLNNTASQQSMTQLVGRVLRQPYQAQTPFAELNESYVFCLRKKAADIAREVKKALEKEGYEGEAASVVDRSGDRAAPVTREARIRPEFRRHYRTPFKGKIYLPHFCVKTGRNGRNGNGYEKLDYYRHLFSRVDVDQFDYATADWDLSQALAAQDAFYRITLEQDELLPIEERQASVLENDEQVMAWLTANLDFDCFSHKQLREIVRAVVKRLIRKNPDLPGRLALVKYLILERLRGNRDRPGLIQRQTDRQTEAAFKKLFDGKKLCFYLECRECCFEIPEKLVGIRENAWLADNNNVPVQHSLFDFVPNDLNKYERDVALFIDKHPEVLWWYRNLVGPNNFAIQGYLRARIYPDFIVQRGKNKKPIAKVLVVESKGEQLSGNPDTKYKREMAGYFEKVGREVSWQELGNGFENHQFRFQVIDEGEYADRDWREELLKLLDDSA